MLVATADVQRVRVAFEWHRLQHRARPTLLAGELWQRIWPRHAPWLVGGGALLLVVLIRRPRSSASLVNLLTLARLGLLVARWWRRS